MEKRKCEPGKIRPAPRASDHDVGIFPRNLHLLQSLQSYDCLVEENVPQHRPDPVFLRPTGRRGRFHRLRNGDPERSL